MHAIRRDTRKIREFFCAVVRIKKRDKKRSNLSLLCSVKHKHTCDIHKRSHLSLSLSFFPSVRANGEERRRRAKEEEEISRKKRYLDDEEEQRLRPVAIGWCER